MAFKKIISRHTTLPNAAPKQRCDLKLKETFQSVYVSFEDWTQQRSLLSFGTNAGAVRLPFQGWRHFKEAFAPEIVHRAVAESAIPVQHCIDPFGGSGTTALACQFLGVHPTTIEVNPYLADLIAAKLSIYDVDILIRDLGTVLRVAGRLSPQPSAVRSALPVTYIEPGLDDRWLFDAAVGARIWALRNAIDGLAIVSHARFFNVLLGGVLLDLSNVLVNGKGRRYRHGWQVNRRDPDSVEPTFAEAAANAIGEIDRFGARRTRTFDLLQGDARTLLSSIAPAELAVFSPPYPNSFDYTDVYNIELWMLGYLDGSAANQTLRHRTLASHVQIHRSYTKPPMGSPRLNDVVSRLEAGRSTLWNRHIPEMIGAYFAEMLQVILDVNRVLRHGGAMWIVIGDSRYGDVMIETAQILAELAKSAGLKVDRIDPFRQMRTSAQQGGQRQLAESLLVLSKC